MQQALAAINKNLIGNDLQPNIQIHQGRVSRRHIPTNQTQELSGYALRANPVKPSVIPGLLRSKKTAGAQR